MEAEREVVEMYRAYLMRDQVGEQFDGTVVGGDQLRRRSSRSTSRSSRAWSSSTALGDDHYEFDETTMRLVGRAPGRSFALGDKVKVEVENGQRGAPQDRLRAARARAHHGAHDGADGRGAKHGRRERRRGSDAVATERGARLGGDHHAGARGKRKETREEKRERNRARDVNKLKVSHAKARVKVKAKGKKRR